VHLAETEACCLTRWGFAADAPAGTASAPTIAVAARNAAIDFALTRAKYLLPYFAGWLRGTEVGRGGEPGDFQGRWLEESEAQLAGDSVALLATGAVTCGGGDGGVEPAFTSLAMEHGNILWSVARYARWVKRA
jgi:hypothetical protein